MIARLLLEIDSPRLRVATLAVVVLIMGWVLARVTTSLIARLVARTAASWDDALLARLRAPLVPIWGLGLFYLGLPWLALAERAEALARRGMRAAAYLVLFWMMSRAVDVVITVLASSERARRLPAARTLLPLGARIAKVGLVAVAIVALLAELGYPVATLIAGLGVGGVALALASQKTVENLFGAFSLGLDEPFKEGDFVKVEEVVGTVEAIGLRSTRIRTLDRTLVSIPNGKLADTRIESFAARDRIRLACTLGLEYGTTAEQMRAVLAGVELVLRDHPHIWPDAVVVRFKELAACSLDIEVMAWFQTSDWSEFQLIRQEILLRFMEVVEQAGAAFAFPTRTIHLAPCSSSPSG